MTDLPEPEKTAVTVGSHWMCRLFVTTGDWKEVEVVEANVKRKGIWKHRVQLVNSPGSARFYVEEKYLQPLGVEPGNPLRIIDDGPHPMTQEQWDHIISKIEDKENQ